MPKNIINEIDNTGSVVVVPASNTVFIPIQVKDTAIEPTLLYSVTDLENTFESENLLKAADAALNEEYSRNLGYNLAKHLLNNNILVLAQGVLTEMTEAQWAALEDKNLYDIRFITNGAFCSEVSESSEASEASMQSMLTTAKNRGDCTALINFNEQDDAFAYDVDKVKGKITGITSGEFGAAFTPAFYTKNGDFVGDDADEVLIPAAFGYLFAYARLIKTNPEWFAAAGFDRGIIPELSKVKHTYTTAEVNSLQNRTDVAATDNVGVAINAIAYVRPAGYIISGNRTLKNNDSVKKLTATSFLNVRNMISIVKKVAFNAANRFTFEQNSETLWANYTSYIEPTLDKIIHSDGAFGYSINRIATPARATLKAEIIIQPIEAVEDISLTVTMTDIDTTVVE